MWGKFLLWFAPLIEECCVIPLGLSRVILLNPKEWHGERRVWFLRFSVPIFRWKQYSHMHKEERWGNPNFMWCNGLEKKFHWYWTPDAS